VQDVDDGMPGGEVIGELAGAIGGVVIDHEEFNGTGRRNNRSASGGRLSLSL